MDTELHQQELNSNRENDPVPEIEHEPQQTQDDYHPSQQETVNRSPYTTLQEPVTPVAYLGLPLLTPSKSTGSTSSSSPPDSIPDGDDHFSDEEEGEEEDPNSELDALSPVETKSNSIRKKSIKLGNCLTPTSNQSNNNGTRSEPGPNRKSLGRKRSVSGLVALRYRSSSQMNSDQHRMLALDLDAYINSSETRENSSTNKSTTTTSPLSSVALFPTLLSRSSNLLPHRSQWVVGSGTGPGNSHRGFIPGLITDS